MREGVLKPLAEAYQFSQARSQALGSPADDSHAVGLVAVARLVLADEAHWRQVLGLDPIERVTAAAKRLHERFTAEVAGHMLIDAPAPYGPPRSLEQRIAEHASLSGAEGVE